MASPCGILDATTGAPLVGSFDLGQYTLWFDVVDLGGDGEAELFSRDSVFHADGTPFPAGSLPRSAERVQSFHQTDLLVTRSTTPQWQQQNWISIYDADLQPVAEFLYAEDEPYDPIPCTADANGDGIDEVFTPTENGLSAWTLDGIRRWSTQVAREGGYPGAHACEAVDLDDDGCPEVIWPQNGQVRVFDAATGALRAESTAAATRTLISERFPIADLDGDGTLEIVVNAYDHQDSTGGRAGVQVIREVSGAWTGHVPTP